jgi:hypothetical protein
MLSPQVAVTGWFPVVELRQYSLRPGQRDVLIELFDGELVEPQEAAGMCVLGQFRDLDRPDRFVWLRGFEGMERRRTALESFYGGPVWRAHARAANATMIDSDDVLLLRPALPGPLLEPPPRIPAKSRSTPPATFVVTLCALEKPVGAAVVEQAVLPAMGAMPIPPLAVFVEEPSENSFPALPVRVGEHVVVLIHRTDERSVEDVLTASRDVAAMLPALVEPPTQLRLEPTAMSRLL